MLFTFILLLFNHTFAKSWQKIIQEHSITDQIILNQLESFKIGTLPTIADICIKSITIDERLEPTINIRTQSHPRIAMLPNPEHPFAHPDCNSGFSCACMMRKAVFEKLVTMLNHLDALAPQFGYESGNISITIFEALRDLATQEQLFNNKREEIRAANPNLTEDRLDQETAKWVSPVKNNVPVHSTGAAVDIRLMYKNKLIDMGKFGVIWGANPSAPTFSENITDEQKMNRLLMLLAATKAGLINYSYEFWHFSYGDRYAAYWQGLSIAQYDSIR